MRTSSSETGRKDERRVPVKGGSGEGCFEGSVKGITQGLDFVRKVGGKDRWEFMYAVCGRERRVC